MLPSQLFDLSSGQNYSAARVDSRESMITQQLLGGPPPFNRFATAQRGLLAVRFRYALEEHGYSRIARAGTDALLRSFTSSPQFRSKDECWATTANATASPILV